MRYSRDSRWVWRVVIIEWRVVVIVRCSRCRRKRLDRNCFVGRSNIRITITDIGIAWCCCWWHVRIAGNLIGVTASDRNSRKGRLWFLSLHIHRWCDTCSWRSTWLCESGSARQRFPLHFLWNFYRSETGENQSMLKAYPAAGHVLRTKTYHRPSSRLAYSTTSSHGRGAALSTFVRYYDSIHLLIPGAEALVLEHLYHVWSFVSNISKSSMSRPSAPTPPYTTILLPSSTSQAWS